MTELLRSYRDKRDFEASPEPKGKRGRKAAKARFVVQKHDARRLHYDLRLEMDGVLKSWAVTRGPSLSPAEKRLAVQTEDHPVDYLAWEGAIPKGQYGGGTMIVWDTGSWEPMGDPSVGLAKGHLEFALHGERLVGRWHLVRMKGRGGEKKQPWLLVKADDEHARRDGDILVEHEASVLSGRTNRDLAEGGVVRADHAARAEVAAERRTKPPASRSKGARQAILPPFVEPALATLVDDVPTGDGWLYEIKHDGYRMQARIDGGSVKLLTRSGLDWTAKFEAAAQALKGMKLPSALIDAEIVVETESGVSSFSALQQALAAGDTGSAVVYAFDLLYLDGRDLRALPLTERKDLLLQVLDDAPPGGPIRFSEHLIADGEAMARHACRLGLEGIVAKRADAPHRSGRTDAWRKIKCSLSKEFVVAGYMPSTTASRSVGSLILGTHEDGTLVHVGRVGTGFRDAVARDLWTQLEPLRIPAAPFAAELPPPARRNARWVETRLVCEVTFRGWTGDRQLRHASFKTLRSDVRPEEVVREKGAAAAKPRMRKPPVKATPLTHPDRVLWPDVGLTKEGLAEYYEEVADRILPHVVDRPLSLLRCPDGLGSCFYQKHAWAGLDDRHIRSVDGENTVVIRDRDGLRALVQSSVLEIHPWGATVSDPNRPDRLVFDLDPGDGVAWDDLVAGALEVRERMSASGLASFVKTTGGKGLHVIVPIEPKVGWDEAKAFAKRIASEMAKDVPDSFVATVSRKAREGRIYVDYLRNQQGATAVAAFSTRARPGAPVSVPIDWSELPSLGSGARFDVTSLLGRLSALQRDPWTGFERAARPLEVAGRRPRRRTS
ncbi:DNA ligase D [Methylobacterium sp. WL30]|uniref:DNA ligase D n=1 Tax=unclassified Methylobacterium TaxID=2615210 RepID=UPI0011CC1BBA|nr:MULTISPECIES: DNA ligase D [unclassified Methylobacterium]TXM95176.1 DNA ligase D [Methylobacterium sp. WL116]TXN41038.1 DNA ligase D [Methylobacterium sp. WL93]TXN49515.1 DNA ligase D [Methylobacterium sp. WL119]TXN69630.1 DNA ligase D [Methylobacterium sp. WL30]